MEQYFEKDLFSGVRYPFRETFLQESGTHFGKPVPTFGKQYTSVYQKNRSLLQKAGPPFGELGPTFGKHGPHFKRLPLFG